MSPATRRYPQRPRDPLQAWDSADELILSRLAEVAAPGQRVLVVNDSFGALSGALAGLDVTSYTDSFVSAKGVALNTRGAVRPIHRLADLSGTYDLVALRIPKILAFLEDILCHLSHHLHAASHVVCGAMVKHQTPASADLVSRYIGAARPSLAHKKARLILATFERAAAAVPGPARVTVASFERPFLNPSNLFSRERLDIGTRFLLEHIPRGDPPVILDLGCANGIIGIAAKRANPRSRVIFCDDSHLAVEGAAANYRGFFPGDDDARFQWTNCYEDGAPGSVDLVLCNPPFHQDRALDDGVAGQMFADARRALVPGGTLRVIGNAHLRYEAALRRLFGNSAVVATDRKFVIVDAVNGTRPAA